MKNLIETMIATQECCSAIVNSIDSSNGIEISVNRTTGNEHSFYFYVVIDIRKNLLTKIEFASTLSDAGVCCKVDDGEWYWRQVEIYDSRPTLFIEQLKATSTIEFCCTIPYGPSNWDVFVNKIGDSILAIDELCLSQQSRVVPIAKTKNKNAQRNILFVARHHACESTASYVLEGLLLEAIREQYDINSVAVPFMDIDGVIEGDQGKGRFPHDHNQDYNEGSKYPEVLSIKDLVARQNFDIAIDLHCPWIKEGHNENFHFVIPNNSRQRTEIKRFGKYLQKMTSCTDTKYFQTSDLEYGNRWNVRSARGLQTFTGYMRQAQPSCLSMTLETPVAISNSRKLNPDSLRSFGKHLFNSCNQYIMNAS